MTQPRKYSKYERFRLRPGKDDDIYDAIHYRITILKEDFPDIARAALRAYLGITPGEPPREAQPRQKAPAAPTAYSFGTRQISEAEEARKQQGGYMGFETKLKNKKE